MKILEIIEHVENNRKFRKGMEILEIIGWQRASDIGNQNSFNNQRRHHRSEEVVVSQAQETLAQTCDLSGLSHFTLF